MRLRELRLSLMSRLDPIDARIIIRLATGLDDLNQLMKPERIITDEEERKAMNLAGERLSGIPMAYIMGEKEFYGLPFRVSEDVLIPRPDTETLVDVAIRLSSAFSNPRILDLCTGSGAVGTAIAHTLSIPVALSDISPAALSIAAENYERNIGKRPDARLGSLLEPWSGSVFDIIATNPPYLTDRWYEETEIDVKKEPSLAFLGGGEDGLDLIRTIAHDAPRYLSEDGALAIECDFRQIESCGRILRNEGFTSIEVERDAAGKERVIYGRRLS